MKSGAMKDVQAESKRSGDERSGRRCRWTDDVGEGGARFIEEAENEQP